MQYLVRLQNINETDQLVFRLIFSLSEKVAGREHSYQLVQDPLQPAAITVQGDAAVKPAAENNPAQVVHFVTGESGAGLPFVIKKPLIATRVLAVLDRFVEQVVCHRKTDAPAAPAVAAPAAEDGQIDFCISEAEASELAIVEDEALANPANLQAEGATGSTETQPEPARQPVKAVSKTAHKPSLVVLPRSAPPQPAPAEVKPAASRKKPRALVVDDSPSVRKQIELELNLFDVDVDFAADAAEARHYLAQQKYEVAFLDVVLPDGDGFQICKAIKQETKQIKVVMLTGKATPADKIKGTMAGCDAYLVKPVGRMTFQNTVCSYLQLREQAEAVQA